MLGGRDWGMKTGGVPEKKMKQLLKYPGAKSRLANWIVNNMPKHNVYLEPYGGSLSVLLNKPRCHIETVNDLDFPYLK